MDSEPNLDFLIDDCAQLSDWTSDFQSKYSSFGCFFAFSLHRLFCQNCKLQHFILIKHELINCNEILINFVLESGVTNDVP